MATQKVRPDPGALERQHGQQRRRTIRRKVGVYGLVAALVATIVLVVVRAGVDSAEQVPGGQPSSSMAPEVAAPFATVTFDGSTCSWERTADNTRAGVVLFEVVNSSERRVMFDSWQLADGYPFPAFKEAIQRDRRLAEQGKQGHAFPSEREVTYLRGDVISANSSEFVAVTMSQGRGAIVCLKLVQGEPPRSRFRPFAVVGPIIVHL